MITKNEVLKAINLLTAEAKGKALHKEYNLEPQPLNPLAIVIKNSLGEELPKDPDDLEFEDVCKFLRNKGYLIELTVNQVRSEVADFLYEIYKRTDKKPPKACYYCSRPVIEKHEYVSELVIEPGFIPGFNSACNFSAPGKEVICSTCVSDAKKHLEQLYLKAS